MSPEKNDNAVCPKCGQKLIYIEHYQSYYCSGCDEHFELAAMDSKASEENVLPQQSIEPETDADLAIKDIEESLVEPESEGSIPPPPPGYRTPTQKIYEEPTTPQSQEPQDNYEDPLIQPTHNEPNNEEQLQGEYDEPNENEYDEPGQYDSQGTVNEESQEDYLESEPSGIQDEEEFLSELESLNEIEDAAGSVPVSSTPLDGSGKKRKRKYKNFRYRTRMIKGSILPILFGVISFQMINSSRLQFPDYYELEAMMILMGFLLGFSIVSGITLVNLVKAKKNSKSGYQLSMKVGVVAYLPFLVIFLALTLFVSLSTGWKFATGFFLASIFPFLIVTMFEASSKGKFFVKEMVDDPSWGRKLVFKQ